MKARRRFCDRSNGKVLRSLWLLLVALGMPASEATAEGFSFTTLGTRALGRGGAFAARADDALALGFNPAALAGLQGGRWHIQLDAHLAFLGLCYDAPGTYTQNPLDGSRLEELDLPPAPETRYGLQQDLETTERPEVCNAAPPQPIPALAVAWRPLPTLGVGIGLLPPAAIGKRRFGDPETLTVSLPDGRRVPSPARYQLAQEDLLLLWPTLGLGWEPLPGLRVGVALGLGYGRFRFLNVTRPWPGMDFANDIWTRLEATDPLVPRVHASIHLVPVPALDVAFGFDWIDAVKAKGEIALRSGYFRERPIEERVPRDECTDAERCERGPVQARLLAPMPWRAWLAVRYASRRKERASLLGGRRRWRWEREPLAATERWDAELDVVYTHGSVVDDFVLDIPDAPEGGRPTLDVGGLDGPLPHRLWLPHRWKGQWTLRLGGGYNLPVPRVGPLSLRAGVSYETRGVERDYVQLDVTPLQRIGVHLGMSAWLGPVELSVAYAHYLQETVEVPPGALSEGRTQDNPEPMRLPPPRDCHFALCVEGQRGVPQTSALYSQLGRGDVPPRIVNAGTYRGGVDVLSLGLRATF